MNNPEFETMDLAVFAVLAGGGAEFQHALWMSPSASRWLVGAAFPYSTGEVDDFLGFMPGRYCDEQVAVDLAMAAYMRACRDNIRGRKKRLPVGLGVTSVLASFASPPRRGGHRVHAAVMTPLGAWRVEVQVAAGQGEEARLADGRLASDVAMSLLRCGLYLGLEGGLPDVDLVHVPEADLMDRLLAWPAFTTTERLTAFRTTDETVLYPGTFNPLHDGHRQNAALLAKAGWDVVFNICVDPPHKPTLTVAQVLERAAMFRLEGLPLLVTRGDSLFVDKIRVHGRDIFMGADSLERALSAAYGDPHANFVALAKAAYDADRYILVAPRKQDGKWKSLDEVLAPLGKVLDCFRYRFKEVRAAPVEISSTAIREAGESPLFLG